MVDPARMQSGLVPMAPFDDMQAGVYPEKHKRHAAGRHEPVGPPGSQANAQRSSQIGNADIPYKVRVERAGVLNT